MNALREYDTAPSPVYSLDEVVRHARERSPYYRALYARLPDSPLDIRQLPLVEHAAFWRANGIEHNTVLTAPLEEGIVFKSGGTTGSPKFSPYTRAEWEVKTTLMGLGLARAGVEPGERVANMFRGGDLYASFLSVGEAMLRCRCPIVEYPLGDQMEPEALVRALADHRITALVSYPTALLKLAEYLASVTPPSPLSVRKVFFAAECMYTDQRALLSDVFCGARVRSFGYASVDAGQLGYADDRCGPDEFIPFSRYSILEIVDSETGQPLEEAGEPGAIVTTNLARLLMPIIRYPVGDRAEWVDPPGVGERRFRLLGRSDVGARVGFTTLYVEDVRLALAPVSAEIRLIAFQLALRHWERKDGLVLRLAALAPPSEPSASAGEILEPLYRQRPELRHAVERGEIHPPVIEWVREKDLERVPRTGKLRPVVDQRGENHA